MRIDIATLFPGMCEIALSESIIGRAQKNGIIDVHCHNIRDYAYNKHNRVDDTPYGGGMGMVMQAEPIYRCYREVCGRTNSYLFNMSTPQDFAEEPGTSPQRCLEPRPHVIYMSPKGKLLNQDKITELSEKRWLFLLCGHYEGVDQRVLDSIVDEEISIGDYVLTGGELPAMVLVDSVARQLKGTLSAEECFEDESHFNGLLEYAHYTKPEVWRGVSVPEVLPSGHHANVKKWRIDNSEKITRERRLDMWEKYQEKLQKKE